MIRGKRLTVSRMPGPDAQFRSPGDPRRHSSLAAAINFATILRHPRPNSAVQAAIAGEVRIQPYGRRWQDPFFAARSSLQTDYGDHMLQINNNSDSVTILYKEISNHLNVSSHRKHRTLDSCAPFTQITPHFVSPASPSARAR